MPQDFISFLNYLGTQSYSVEFTKQNCPVQQATTDRKTSLCIGTGLYWRISATGAGPLYSFKKLFPKNGKFFISSKWKIWFLLIWGLAWNLAVASQTVQQFFFSRSPSIPSGPRILELCTQRKPVDRNNHLFWLILKPSY